MDIVGGIAAATQALNIAKVLRNVEKDYDASTYKSQIIELIDALTDAKISLSDAKEQLALQAAEIARLKANFELKQSLVKGEGDYSYLTDDDANPVGYPVCPRCASVDGRIIQMTESRYVGNANCPACSKDFNPVICYLPKGSGFRTKQDRERAEVDAANARSRDNSQYF